MLIDAANAAGVPVSYIAAGDVIKFNGMDLQVLFPYDSENANAVFQGENNSSLVIRAVYGNHAVLLTGDIEENVEKYLLGRASAAGNAVNAQVLQIPHHGSRSSATNEFLQAVAPQAAVISAGRNNQFGHPHEVVTERLREHGITYFNTATHGAVMLRTDGKNMTVKTMLTP